MHELDLQIHHLEKLFDTSSGALVLAHPPRIEYNRKRYLSAMDLIDSLSIIWNPSRLSITRRLLLILYLHDQKTLSCFPVLAG